MLSRWVRTWHSSLLKPFLGWLAALGVTPNVLTLLSWGIITLAGILMALGHLMLGSLTLALGAVLDGLDGELARLLHAESRLGAFLDSIADHYGDFAIYLGLFWYFLQRDTWVEPLLILIACFGSLIGSQIRSRASMVGIETKNTGFATRLERMLILLVGLLANQIAVALGLLAIINNASALQRLVYTVQAASLQDSTPRH